jgi:hypothetical protein
VTAFGKKFSGKTEIKGHIMFKETVQVSSLSWVKKRDGKLRIMLTKKISRVLN